MQPAQDAPEAPLLAALGTDDAPAQEQCEITPYDMDASGETQVLLATGEDTEEASHDTGANVEYVGQEQGVVLISYDLKEEPLPDVSQGEQAVNYADIPFGETAVLNAYSQPAEKVETAVLSQKDLYYKADPHLVQQRTGTKIPIWGDCFTLGKGYGQVNYAITDNPAISRRHAAVLTKAGEYFLLDYNSTNHTYLNDELIYSGKEVKIKHGTKVKLADETFTFYER